ncbi:unnamed protein product [Sympodiomycopsis kandeliae]
MGPSSSDGANETPHSPQATGGVSSPRPPTHTSSIAFSLDSRSHPRPNRHQHPDPSQSPPELQRLDSVPLTTTHHRLPFVPDRISSPPAAPARNEEEGITSATIHSVPQHNHKRQGSRHNQQSHPRRSESSFHHDSPSRSHSLRELISKKKTSDTVQSSNRRSRSRSRNRSRQYSDHRDPLQQAADSLDDPQNDNVLSEHSLQGNEKLQVRTKSTGTSKPRAIVQKLKPTRLVDLHRLRPDIAGQSILPTVAFPGQGSGRESEFLQEAPIWSRYPWKALYLVYFGLSVGFVFLPWFAFVSIFPSMRARASWTWKRSTMVRLYRHGTRLTFRTHTNLSRDLSKPVPHSETLHCKFIWIEGTPQEDIRGELRRAMEMQKIESTRTCGFWYGEPLSDDLCSASEAIGAGSKGVGRRAGVDEKVVYHLHGGAYWIGTAHEDDVTAAVNTQVLRYLSELYKSGESKATKSNRCTRSLSLDYRLSVPNRPRLGSYPAALLDAVAGYLYLIRFCGFKPQNVIVAGDSAGGNLALALCRYLRDEKIEGMPGSLLLLSPWADVSRSHSGPLGMPNLFSSVNLNKDADIISNSVAFRNTAVSAFIGDLPAKETYTNPYLSSCSLQLDPSNGGDGPDWGFENFPKKTYLVTGSAEISNDQHLTLAHRMASGTKKRFPIYTGDEISRQSDPYEMTARLNYPRPSDFEISIWPSATTTPAPADGAIDSSTDGEVETSQSSQTTKNNSDNDAEGNFFQSANQVEKGSNSLKIPPAAAADADLKKTDSNGPPDEMIADEKAGRGCKDDSLVKTADFGSDSSQDQSESQRPGFTSAVQSEHQKQPVLNAPQTDSPSELPQSKLPPPSTPSGRKPSRPRLAPAPSSSSAFYRAQSRPNIPTINGVTEEPEEESDDEEEEEEGNYFAMGGQDRKVWLDEVKDGVHDLLLFPWHEPERGLCWKRIAKWIDEQ